MGWVTVNEDGSITGDPEHLICGKLEVKEHQHTADCFAQTEQGSEADAKAEENSDPAKAGDREKADDQTNLTSEDQAEPSKEAATEKDADKTAADASSKKTDPEQSGQSADQAQADNTDQANTDEKSGKASDQNNKAESTDSSDKTTADSVDSKTAEAAAEEAEAKEDSSTVQYEDFDLTYAGEGYTIHAAGSADACIPADAELKVNEISQGAAQYLVYSAFTAKTLAPSKAIVTGNRFFDISFISNGKEVEPAAPVAVEFSFDQPQKLASDDVKVIHFAKVGPEVLDNDPSITDQGIEKISFQADEFSVYGIIYIGALSIDYLAQDGQTYEVSVDIPKEAYIPEGSELVVEELTQGTDKFEEYLEKTTNTLRIEQEDLDYIKLLDISLVKDGQEIEPAVPVNVSIKLKDKKDIKDTKVIHFAENPVEMDADAKGSTLSFETPGFSVYAVVEESTDEYARATVNFYGLNTDTPIATFYVKNSDVFLGNGERQENVSYLEDIVTDPGAGSLENGYLFRGWSPDDLMKPDGTRYVDSDTYVGSQYETTTKEMTIEGIREYLAGLQIKEGDIVNIYAMIFKYYNVTYFGDDINGDPNWEVSYGTDTVLLRTDATSAPYTVNMPYSSTSNQNFKGWVPTA